ncbi:muskelin isoform X2 [Plodia interpunctella]|uniref:muskelin isoform X2 n=1 Tax=Plodia interpunctella TaxID=58824 RepID=UPI002367AF41|nr:muskelin isoform X2 [Plodia interpunctella]
MDEKYDTVKLCYTIHRYSSHSANYIPENIMVNNPSDQLSRWFTDSTTPAQYIMLKLKSVSIVETIKFGKYIKAHVSDLKKFQIFGGVDENNLSLLLSAGLKKDSSAETFRLRHRTTEGLYLPVTYLKIVPLQSWGPAYNYTIWYVELQGKNQEELINDAMETINLRKEEEAVRILLKHLRRRRYKDAFEALSRETGVRLEGDLQARLWNALVENGDYKLAEEIMETAVNEGELDWYMSWQPYTPEWRQMSACSAAVEERLCCDSSPQPRGASPDLACADRDPRAAAESPSSGSPPELCSPSCCNSPGPRGGHQLVVDSTTGTLYLYGGWNGTVDLDDLWAFDTERERWTLLCAHSGQVNGPSPRSCHKMVLDPVRRKLYTLGRYLDSAQRVAHNMNSDLYMFDIATNTWSLLCADTAAAGGPRLVFDHQMCIDPDTQTIYVFGGRVLPANTEEVVSPQYSGLYAYYISTSSWQQLLPDQPHDGGPPSPQPRVSHSMLFHPIQRRLYIFAGQRNKEHLLDLWWWDVADGSCRALCVATCASPPPAAGFTQRATLDPDTDEMFVLSGMSKEKDKRVYNTLWVFSLRRMTWTCVYRNDSVAPSEPRPRFAHQLVLDPVRKVHYLFGGNPGNQSSPRLRLDDLWALRLRRVSSAQLRARTRLALREARYRQLAAASASSSASASAALLYLRNDLSDAMDHSDPEQVSRFQKLATALFAGAARTAHAPAALCARGARALARRRARAAPAELAHHAHALHAVLGSVESLPEPVVPFEEVSLPAPDTWDVGEDADEEPPTREREARAARIQLYDHLCQYFRPSTVPPKGDIMDLVSL